MFQEQIEQFVEWPRSSDLGSVVWLPITHYNGDALLLRELADYVPHSILLPPLSPDITFRTIDKLSALISSSLHASLFAYAQGILILGYQPVGKLAAFLEERDQGQALYMTVEDINRALPGQLGSPRFSKMAAER